MAIIIIERYVPASLTASSTPNAPAQKSQQPYYPEQSDRVRDSHCPSLLGLEYTEFRLRRR